MRRPDVVSSRSTVIVLAGFIGIGQVLDRLSARSMGDTLSIPLLFLLVLTLGPILGIVMVYVAAALLHLTGKWLGGSASSAAIRAAYAWSSVPIVAALVLWIPYLLIAGREMFTRETPELDASPSKAMAIAALGLVESALVVWTIVLLLKCLSEVQHFSVWKAGENVLLGVLAPLALIAFVVLTFKSIVSIM